MHFLQVFLKKIQFSLELKILIINIESIMLFIWINYKWEYFDMHSVAVALDHNMHSIAGRSVAMKFDEVLILPFKNKMKTN